MKKTILILVIMLMLCAGIFIPVNISNHESFGKNKIYNSQFTLQIDTAYFAEDASVLLSYKKKDVVFDFYIDGEDTLTSTPFTMQGYNTVVKTNRLLYSASAKPKITILRQHSVFAGEWTTVKTITTADSLETVQAVDDTLSPGWHRYIFLGTSTNPSDTRGRWVTSGSK